MLTRLRPGKPSPALVISCIALFVALSGTSYAVITLPKNSVGAKQLKRNAVTSAKVKDDALTGVDVNEATLGQVPSAANAVSAANAQTAQGAANAEKLDGIDSTGFLPTEGTAADARLLDGIDSSAFVQGGGRTQMIFARLIGAGNTKTIFSANWNGAPNSTTFVARLNAVGTTTFTLTYGGAGSLAVWIDDGGADPAVSRLSMGQSVTRTVASDQIIFMTYYAAFRVAVASFSAGSSDTLTELVEPTLITRFS
jgi:hypothetical protein